MELSFLVSFLFIYSYFQSIPRAELVAKITESYKSAKITGTSILDNQ